MSQPPPGGRLFLVGCVRSGTTLLQSLLSAHSQIASFPETDYFKALVGQAQTRWEGVPLRTANERIRQKGADIRLRLGIGRPNGRRTLSHFLAEINRPEMSALYPSAGNRLRPQIDGFVSILDTLTREQGKSIWLEKSPCHVGYIDVIEQYVQPARIIHLLRSGTDVVASIYDAAQKYPGTHWNSNWGTLDRCISQWNNAIQQSQRHLHKPNHKAVTYEKLVSDPECTLTELCAFVGVPYEPNMLQEYQSAAKQVVLEKSVWKSGVFKPIANANSTKFYELLDADQRSYVTSRLLPLPTAD